MNAAKRLRVFFACSFFVNAPSSRVWYMEVYVENRTKQKFAKIIQELMTEKSLHKITVNDIVERSSMTRQSFYYHFHDIYELLEWTCDIQLFRAQPDNAGMEQWIAGLVGHLYQYRRFYRKIYLEYDEQLLERMLKSEIEKQIRHEFERRNHREPSDRELYEFMLDFISSSCAHYLQKWVCTINSDAVQDMKAYMVYLVECVWNGYEATPKNPVKVREEIIA